MSGSGAVTVVSTTTTIDVAADQRSYTMTFPNTGRVRFKIIALNTTGASTASAYSTAIQPEPERAT